TASPKKVNRVNQPVAIIIHVHMVSLRGGDKVTHPPRLRLRGPGRLTISAARTDLALLIRRAVRPPVACSKRNHLWQKNSPPRGDRRRRIKRSLVWSGRRDLNPRQLAWEARTLPLSYARPYFLFR